MNPADGNVPVDTAPRTTDALIERLSRHAAVAADRLAAQFQPRAAHGIGFVDAIAVDDVGLTWVLGWMMDDAVFDRPLVIVDGESYPASFACALTERSDVPAGGRGFVGVIRTDWRTTTHSRPRFFLADQYDRYLETIAPVPVRTKRAIAPAVRAMLDGVIAGHGELLREMFHAVSSWDVPEKPDSSDRVSVDEVAILPGFGALVTGWALSPNKLSDRFTLKVGERIIAADEFSVARFARPDLSHLHGHIPLALARAGFTAVFRGDLTDLRLGEMVLKSSWADSTSTNIAVPPDRIRLLGGTVPIDHALIHYPAIESERFFPDFAHHAAVDARRHATSLSSYEERPVGAAVVLGLPGTVSDLFLMVDRALQGAAALPEDWGIVLVGCPDGMRGLLISLFADLKRVTGRHCSLFLSPPGRTTNDMVATVIDALGLTRFAYISADCLLTGDGWRAIGEAIAPCALLEICDPAAEEAAEGTTGLDAFVCDAEVWRHIAAGTQPRIGGMMLKSAIPMAAIDPPIITAAALSLCDRRPSLLVSAINRAVGMAAHG